MFTLRVLEKHGVLCCSGAQALSVGIFPYVLKLLQSPAKELRPYLVFIWTKLLAADPVRATSTTVLSALFLIYSLHL